MAALRLGAEVVCVSRSGAPVRANKKWADDVRWVKGDIFKPTDYASEVCKTFSTQKVQQSSIASLAARMTIHVILAPYFAQD